MKKWLYVFGGSMLISWSIVMFLSLDGYNGIIDINRISEGFLEAYVTLIIGLLIISDVMTWKSP